MSLGRALRFVLPAFALAHGAHAAPALAGSKTESHAARDARLQRTAERLLAGADAPAGAVVMSDVRTGRVIVWASRGKGADYVSHPYAPAASVFKIATAAALDAVAPSLDGATVCYAGGERSIGPRDLVPPSKHDDKICIPYRDALGKSANAVFARLAAEKLERDDVLKFARALGFDGAPGADFAAPANKVDVPRNQLGFARAAAGFWNGKLSPLGALFVMQTIANNGERIALRRGPEGAVARKSLGRGVSTETATKLRRMLEVTVRSGTCTKAFRAPGGKRYLDDVRIAAKTGTLVGGKPARMFSWFAGFAPADKPEIAIAVMLANDVKWKTKGNLVGRDMLRAYFNR